METTMRQDWWETKITCPKCGYKCWVKVIKKYDIDVCPMCGQEIKMVWKKAINLTPWSDGDLFRFMVL